MPMCTTVVQRSAVRTDVERVIIHAGVTAIEAEAFRGWTGLREVVFEAGGRLGWIGSHAFAGTALCRVATPPGLKELGAGAFAGCGSLRSARLNEGLRQLGSWDSRDGVFQDSALESVYVPSTLEAMRPNAFVGCDRLRVVEVAEGCAVDVTGCVGPAVEVRVTAAGAQSDENLREEDGTISGREKDETCQERAALPQGQPGGSDRGQCEAPPEPVG